jgi:hypothetical protein
MTTRQPDWEAIDHAYRDKPQHITTIPISAMSVLKGRLSSADFEHALTTN